MYKVFVNNSEIVLSTESHFSKNHTSFHIKEANVEEIITKLVADPSLKFHLYHKSYERLFQKLFKKIDVVVAGGGKVYNNKNEILFIQRNGKWDLPKGKTEKKEPIADSALREVMEETGIEDLEIKRFLKRTLHVYKRNGAYKIKLTYWFEMFSNYTGDFSPQLEEDITKVKWKNQKKTKKALKNTYSSIKELFPFEYFN